MEDKVNFNKNIWGVLLNIVLKGLNSVDYVCTALNDIRSFELFHQYKLHMKQAMNDIRDSLQCISDVCYRNVNNGEENDLNQMEFNSKSLGLRYNYDQYLLKMFPVNQNACDINKRRGRYYYEYPSTSNEEIDNGINKLKRHSYSTSHRNNVHTSLGRNVNYDLGNKDDDNKVKLIEQPSIKTHKLLTPSHSQNIQLNKGALNNKKKKVTRVTDLVMKINSDQELYDLTIQLFGDDILDKLMSPNVENVFIENVEKTIDEIERLRAKDIENSNNNNASNNKQNQPIKIKHSLRNQLSHIPKTQTDDNVLIESPDTKPTQDEEATQAYADELLIKSGLLEKSPKALYGKAQKGNKRSMNSGSNNEGYRHPKIFMNYMSQYGQYFDSSLQNGGLSKLPPYDKSKNQRIVSPVRKYINSSFNIPNV